MDAPTSKVFAEGMEGAPNSADDRDGLRANNLAKAFKGRKVVKDVSLHLRRGEIVGLLGPNGAGKTTCFYMMMGRSTPMPARHHRWG